MNSETDTLPRPFAINVSQVIQFSLVLTFHFLFNPAFWDALHYIRDCGNQMLVVKQLHLKAAGLVQKTAIQCMLIRVTMRELITSAAAIMNTS